MHCPAFWHGHEHDKQHMFVSSLYYKKSTVYLNFWDRGNEQQHLFIFLQGRILTSVDSAVFVDRGQHTGKWIANFLLNLVTGQQFELLRCDRWKAIELEGEVDVVGPIGTDTRCWDSVKRREFCKYSENNNCISQCHIWKQCGMQTNAQVIDLLPWTLSIKH